MITHLENQVLRATSREETELGLLFLEPRSLHGPVLADQGRQALSTALPSNSSVSLCDLSKVLEDGPELDHRSLGPTF